MQRFDTVAIIGVGLLGGSIGLALRKRRLAKNVVGIGRRRSTLAKALDLTCVTRTTTSIARGVAEAQLIVVCTPVENVPSYVAEAVTHCPAGALITDVGSTKQQLVAATESAIAACDNQVDFVGSHPLAGSERTGAEAAQADLFVDRLVIVTPTGRTRPDATSRAKAFWESLGARVIQMSPHDHDAALAHTSHLPHLIASAVAAATPAESLPLTATGWRDTTRVAAGDAELWRQILLSNQSHTLKALTDFETVLAQFRKALESSDGTRLMELLAEGKRRRDAVGS